LIGAYARSSELPQADADGQAWTLSVRNDKHSMINSTRTPTTS
jgi:hypothetical protein